jgi:PEP-CTERM motif
MSAKSSLVYLAAISSLATLLAGRSQAAIVASDAATNSAYAPLPNNSWSSVNGGSGFNNWTALSGATGGGVYMENSGRQVNSTDSFALYAGSGSYAVSRSLTSGMTSGEFDILTRFDLSGTGNNLFNLRTGNNTSGFGSGELLSFGIVNGTTLDYTDGSGFHTLASGDARGVVWSWIINFNTSLGSYSLSVADTSGSGFSTSVSGGLESTNASVGSFAAINSSAGANQNLIFDKTTFSATPEPSTLALFGTCGVAALWIFRRRH